MPDPQLPRPPYEPAGVPGRGEATHRRPQPQDDLLRQAPEHGDVARPPRRGRQPRCVPRQGRPVPRPVAAGQPAADDLRDGRCCRGRRAGRRRAGGRRPLPHLPAHEGGGVLGRRPRGEVRQGRRRGPSRADPRRGAGPLRGARRPPRLRLGAQPGGSLPGGTGPPPVPLRGGTGHPAGSRAPAPGDPGVRSDHPHRRRRRAADRVRRAPPLRAHRPVSARSASRSPTTWPSRTR